MSPDRVAAAGTLSTAKGRCGGIKDKRPRWALAGRFEAYRAHLETAPLAAHARRTYAGRVARYLSWLAELDPLTRRQGDTFTDGHARDYTVRDYCTHLLSAGRAKPASVNLTLAAVDHFYRFIGLGPANTPAPGSPPGAGRRPDPPAAARTAIGPGGIRDRAIACVLLFTRLRVAELVALDVDDLSISARKGQLTVRRGKGERYRQVPVNAGPDRADPANAYRPAREAHPRLRPARH